MEQKNPSAKSKPISGDTCHVTEQELETLHHEAMDIEHSILCHALEIVQLRQLVLRRLEELPASHGQQDTFEGTCNSGIGLKDLSTRCEEREILRSLLHRLNELKANADARSEKVREWVR